MKAKINNALVKALPQNQDVDIYDTRLTGFILRVRKSGRHSYRVSYARGKSATIGRLCDLTPAQAREEAQKIQGDAAKGIDILAAKKRRNASTLNAYLTNIYEPWVTTHRRTGAATIARLRTHFGHRFGKKPLNDITPLQIEN